MNLPDGADAAFSHLFQTTIELVEGRFTQEAVHLPSFKKDRPSSPQVSSPVGVEKQRQEEERKREAKMAEQRRMDAERLKQEAMASVHHLIERGRFAEAELVLNEHFDLGEEFAAHRIALLLDWKILKNEYETAYRRQDFRKALEKLRELIYSVPEGEGKSKLEKEYEKITAE